MSEAMTYQSLIQDVITYCERSDTDFVEQVPRFIMMAENRLASEVRGLGFQQYATGTLNAAVFAKPARWRETVSFSVTTADGRRYLQPRTYDYCRAYEADSVAGTPRYYADYQYEHFLVVPTSLVPVPFELSYYERPVPLSDANQTNWTTQYAPQLILYATLLEAQPYLRRPELLAQWTTLYDRALQGISQESSRRISADRATAQRNGE